MVDVGYFFSILYIEHNTCIFFRCKFCHLLQTGKSRGFAFVYFESQKDATEAKDECTGMEIDGRRIRVDYSITKRPHTPTPGIYMGRPTT